MIRILIAVVVIAVVGFTGYRYFIASDEGQQVLSEATEKATEAVGQAAESAGEQLGGLREALAGLSGEASEVGNTLQTTLSDLTSTLGGVDAQSSADAVNEELGSITTQLESLGGQIGGLSDESRKLIATGIAAALPTIKAAAEQITQIDGVGAAVRPALDSIIATLEDWAQAPA